MKWHFQGNFMLYQEHIITYTMFPFLDKACEIDDHVECYQENQDKTGSVSVCCECPAFGALCLVTTACISARQKLYKCGTCKKYLKYNVGFNSHYVGKNSNGFYAQRESVLHSKHEQTLFGVKYCESNGSGKIVKKPQLMCQQICMGGKPFRCSYGGNIFSSKSCLVVHLRTYAEMETCKCDGCARDISPKCHLSEEYQGSHTGEMVYECSECGKVFSREDQLVSYQRTHSGQKPYGCNECGKAFTSQSYLVVHMRAHTGKKPHECGKSFSFSSHLIVHQRIHTGESPYECSECGRAFSRKYHLTSHQSTHAGRNVIGAANVGKSLVASHTSLYTWELIQEVNHMNVTNVGKLLFGNHYSLYTNEFMQGKTLTNAVNVRNPSVENYGLLYIRELTQERNPMDAVSVTRPSLGNLSSLYITELIQGRNPMDVKNVEKPSRRNLFSAHMRGLTQERNPGSALDVGRLFVGSHSSWCIKDLMQMRNLLTS